jgi:sucrose-6-phosphate hydrolase SacC (GH32 family)
MKQLITISILLILFCLMGNSQEIFFDIEHAPAPLFRCPIFDGTTDPTVMWHKQRNEWWILYTQRRANQSLPPYVSQVYGCAIGIAASKDHGKLWYYVGTANLPQPDQGYNTFWAPHVFEAKGEYHMIVTYIPGVYSYWGGDCRLIHYKSKDMMNWEMIGEVKDTHDKIDGSVFQLPDGTWKMWYKGNDAKTYTSLSKDLKKWEPTGKCEIDDVEHEGPVVFYWKGKYWMIVDECSLGYVGLHCYESSDCAAWKRNSTILNAPGKREDDNDQGRHCDVKVVGDRAYIFYFTHPGRVYDAKGIEIEEKTWQYHRASLQVAELELINGKITCDRDKYYKK